MALLLVEAREVFGEQLHQGAAHAIGLHGFPHALESEILRLLQLDARQGAHARAFLQSLEAFLLRLRIGGVGPHDGVARGLVDCVLQNRGEAVMPCLADDDVGDEHQVLGDGVVLGGLVELHPEDDVGRVLHAVDRTLLQGGVHLGELHRARHCAPVGVSADARRRGNHADFLALEVGELGHREIGEEALRSDAVKAVIFAGAPGKRKGMSNMPSSGTTGARKPAGKIIPCTDPACSARTICAMLPREEPWYAVALRRPFEYFVISSANLAFAAAWVSFAVALPMRTSCSAAAAAQSANARVSVETGFIVTLPVCAAGSASTAPALRRAGSPPPGRRASRRWRALLPARG